MARELPDSKDCPICGKPVGQVNNHVRMSDDDDHGPQAMYPENWDTDARDLVDEEPRVLDVPAGDGDGSADVGLGSGVKRRLESMFRMD